MKDSLWKRKVQRKQNNRCSWCHQCSCVCHNVSHLNLFCAVMLFIVRTLKHTRWAPTWWLSFKTGCLRPSRNSFSFLEQIWETREQTQELNQQCPRSAVRVVTSSAAPRTWCLTPRRTGATSQACARSPARSFTSAAALWRVTTSTRIAASARISRLSSVEVPLPFSLDVVCTFLSASPFFLHTF